MILLCNTSEKSAFDTLSLDIVSNYSLVSIFVALYLKEPHLQTQIILGRGWLDIYVFTGHIDERDVINQVCDKVAYNSLPEFLPGKKKNPYRMILEGFVLIFSREKGNIIEPLAVGFGGDRPVHIGQSPGDGPGKAGFRNSVWSSLLACALDASMRDKRGMAPRYG